MPRLDITELDKELGQKKFRPIYVIVGAERHLVLDAIAKIESSLSKQEGGIEKTVFRGKEAKVEDVFNYIKTIPLLGGRPLVVIRDAESISKNLLDEFATYAASPIEASTLLITAEKLDGRSRFMMLAAKSGAVIECKPLYSDKVPFWINMEVRKNGRQISQEAAKFMADMVGNDLGLLTQAIDKVILYIGDKKMIDVSDVETAIAETHQRDVFEFTDAVGRRSLANALSILRNLFDQGQTPILVLNMLARHFRILSKAKEITSRSSDNTQIASYLGVHPYFAKNYVVQSKNFSKSELRSCFGKLHKCDKALRQSRIPKQRIIEKALFEIMGKS